MKLNILFIIVLLLSSCKASNSNNKSIVANPSADTTSLVSGQNNLSRMNKYPPIALFNNDLIGLSIKDSLSSDILKRYQIDFYSECMCDATSLLIDTITDKLYLYNYCSFGTPPNTEDIYYEYAIDKVQALEEEVVLFLNNGIIINRTEQQVEYNKDSLPRDFIISIVKVNEFPIYQLKVVDGELPSSYIGSRMNEFFTYKVDKIKKYDCGDFDG